MSEQEMDSIKLNAEVFSPPPIPRDSHLYLMLTFLPY